MLTPPGSIGPALRPNVVDCADWAGGAAGETVYPTGCEFRNFAFFDLRALPKFFIFLFAIVIPPIIAIGKAIHPAKNSAPIVAALAPVAPTATPKLEKNPEPDELLPPLLLPPDVFVAVKSML
jgi:hypothetical protein